MSPRIVAHLVPGPDRHGVTRHSLGLLGQVPLRDEVVVRFGEGTSGPADLAAAAREVASADLVHVHLTDHLLGPTASVAAEQVVALAGRRRVSLTLHDLPQPADGDGRFQRRRAAYAAMAAASVGVVVASEHERRLLESALTHEHRLALTHERSAGFPPIVVIPLPIDRLPPDPKRSVPAETLPPDRECSVPAETLPPDPKCSVPAESLPPDRECSVPAESLQPDRKCSVPAETLHSPRFGIAADASPDTPPAPARMLAVLGFLYPGKGHAAAIEALPALPNDVGVIALGEPSAGHGDLPAELCAMAASLDRTFRVTGHVPTDELDAVLRGAAVPVAPHLHVSASGSIGTWLSAGRRPLVPSGPYTDELEHRCPGALLRYGPGTAYSDLVDAAAAALAEPGLTWLGDDVRLGPGWHDCADQYARALHRWVRS